MPLRSEIADHPPVLQGVFVTIEADTGKAVSIERFTRSFSL
jgi:calcineurin-like phosphoesterase